MSIRPPARRPAASRRRRRPSSRSGPRPRAGSAVATSRSAGLLPIAASFPSAARGGRTRTSRPPRERCDQDPLQLGGSPPATRRSASPGSAADRAAPRSRHAAARPNTRPSISGGGSRPRGGEPRPDTADELSARRRPRLQVGPGPGGIIARLPRRRDPRCSSATETRDDAGVYRSRRPRARPDARLLHADRRRPLRLRPGRGGERALATSTRWAAAVDRAQYRRFSLERLGATCWPRSSRRRRHAAEAGCRDRRRPFDRRPRAQVRPGRDRRVHPDRIVRNSTARSGRRAVPDQAARRRLLTTAAKRGPARRRWSTRCVETMTHPERRGRRSGARRRRPRHDRRDRLRPARPPARAVAGRSGVGRTGLRGRAAPPRARWA